MPFGTPPSGGPLSRTRRRISASSLTKYLRCPKQFFLSNKLGLSSPKSISQILGIVLEDSLCSILMRRPVSINSLNDLRDWCFNLAEEEAKNCLNLVERIGNHQYGKIHSKVGKMLKLMN